MPRAAQLLDRSRALQLVLTLALVFIFALPSSYPSDLLLSLLMRTGAARRMELYRSIARDQPPMADKCFAATPDGRACRDLVNGLLEKQANKRFDVAEVSRTTLIRTWPLLLS